MSGPPANSFTPLPFGARDLKVYPLTGESYPASGIDLPNYQKLTFAEAESFEELRGDDNLVAVHGKGPQVNWEIDGGGVSLDCVKAMYGGTIVETGVWNNGAGTGKRVLTKHGTDVRPYFRVEGQAISDSGGDFHVVLYRSRATSDLTGSMDDAAFWTTGFKGEALPRVSDSSLYDLVQNEQAVAVP
jgi:hypothetical protein